MRSRAAAFVVLFLTAAACAAGAPAPATPAGAYRAYVAAGHAGDKQKVLALTVPDAPAQQLAAAALDRVAAQHAFERALIDKFGAAGKKVIPPQSPPPEVTTAPRSDGSVELQIAGRAVAIARQVDGQWKIDPRMQLAGEAVNRNIALSRQMAAIAEKQAHEVLAGQYATAEDAANAFRTAWRAAVAAAMPATSTAQAK